MLRVSLCPCFRPSVLPPVVASVCLAARPSVRLAVHPSVGPSAVRPAVRPSLRLSVRPTIRPFIGLSVRPMSVCLSFGLSCPCLSVFLSVCLSVYTHTCASISWISIASEAIPASSANRAALSRLFDSLWLLSCLYYWFFQTYIHIHAHTDTLPVCVSACLVFF